MSLSPSQSLCHHPLRWALQHAVLLLEQGSQVSLLELPTVAQNYPPFVLPVSCNISTACTSDTLSSLDECQDTGGVGR